MKSSLEHKTVRPGSLTSYSFYYSNRRAPQTAGPASKQTRLGSSFGHRALLLLLIPIIVLAAVLFGKMHADNTSAPSHPPAVAQSSQSPIKKSAPAVAATPAVNECAGNNLSQFIKVSVGQRHFWACQGARTLYDAPVITGIEQHASTETPIGTYKIYNKKTDTVLTGADETGSWRDPVSYWMPFLDNQYGTYGFHDATWRANTEFGTVDPNTDKASHGCVELSLAASKWLYNWANTGVTVTVET